MRCLRAVVAGALVAAAVGSSAGVARGQSAAERMQAENAKAVLNTYCYRCHGQNGRNEGGLNVVTDLKKLVESKRVVPGEPDRSKLLKRIVSGDMPPEIDFEDKADDPKPIPRPKPEEIAVLRGWIAAGAPDSAPKQVERRFISDEDVLKLILDDIQRAGTRDRRFLRYFTLTHLENAGYNADQLQTYRIGLSKLINSLSWNRRIKVPNAIDPGKTILRIDLRDYLWDEVVWQSVLDQYPYGLLHEGLALRTLCELAACDLPYVRADWFVYAASRPPLYHEVLRLPDTIEALERKLDVDVSANIRQDRVARAAFNASGVSRNNRLIERHESTNGGYWRSYDFGGNADRKNLFAHPLGPGEGEYDFEHDGGETIFTLPNGLNGYMLIDAAGKRLDKGPTQIVRDNKQSDGSVVNGISCMSCHNQGFIEKADQVRAVVSKTKAADKDMAETVMALYPPREQMDELMRGDLERFARAVKETGASLSRTEPVYALAIQFEEEINEQLAAAEAGLQVKEFQDTLNRTPQLSQALGPLLVGATVKRDVYVDAFPHIAEALHLKTLDAATPKFVAGNSASTRGGASGAKPIPTIRSGPGRKKEYPPDQLKALPPNFFGGDQNRFRDVGPAGSLLVGVRVSTHQSFGGPKVSSVVPIFRSGRILIEGERHGDVNSAETTAIAKPGYAVGALRTHTGLSVDGFAVVFMKVKGDQLDPSDSYNSPWLGDTNGGSPNDVMNTGSLVVGLQGRAGKEVNALGLIVVK